MSFHLSKGLAAVLLLAVTACSDADPRTTQEKAEDYCVDQGGRVVALTLGDQSVLQCRVEETVQFDDGVSIYSHNYDLLAFYDGSHVALPMTEQHDAPLVEAPSANPTLRQKLHSRVVDILDNLDNTGYSHNRNDNFCLDPDIDSFPFDDGETDSYNLFLDCSGFVGYYALQGIVESLYDELEDNSTYSCSRPLAADFAHVFKSASNNFVEATQADIDSGNVCWGQIKHLENVKPGDIIVYAHEENFGDETKVCSDGRTITLAKCLKRNDDGVCTQRKNTGHVLFVHKAPYRSKHCKDDTFLGFGGCYDNATVASGMPGDYQWVVQVADSTTSPHSWDTRKAGENRSNYNGNPYHAWTKTYHGVSDLALCNDGEYHRDCSDHGGVDQPIVINTSHETNPTGVGVGYMYVNDGRDGFRTKYGSDTEAAQIYFGRPVKCDSL